MSYVKEYDSPNGKFYSSWAFNENSHELSKQNHEVLRKFDGKYIKAHGDWRDVEKVCSENPDKMVYVETTQTYHEQHFSIVQNPDNLSEAELALIVDGGNLCFGFKGSQTRIDIYTD